MRFSTVGIVAATFAFGVFSYATAFSTTSTQYQSVGPAAWPTLVDSRNIIQMGRRQRLHKLSQEIKERHEGVPVDETKPESEARLQATKRMASLSRAPLLPNLSTSSSSRKQASSRSPHPVPVPVRKSLLLALDRSAFDKALKEKRKVAIVLPERKVLSALSHPKRASRDVRPLRLASTVKARPRFDTFTRSSLGGPKPADLPIEYNAPTVVSPPALVKQMGRSKLQSQNSDGFGDVPRSTAAIRETDKLAAGGPTPRAPRSQASFDPEERPLPPLAEPLQTPAVEDGDAERTSQRRLAAVAVRSSRARNNPRARQSRQARRGAQRRRAKTKRRHVRLRHNARGSRHAKRRRTGNHRRFQALRSRKIANELRLRRRIRGVY